MGDLDMSNNNLGVIANTVQRLLSSIGVKAKFGGGEAIYDFIATFNKSLKKDRFSWGLKRTLRGEAIVKGELKEDVAGFEEAIEAYQTEDAKERAKKLQESRRAGYDYEQEITIQHRS